MLPNFWSAPCVKGFLLPLLLGFPLGGEWEHPSDWPKSGRRQHQVLTSSRHSLLQRAGLENGRATAQTSDDGLAAPYKINMLLLSPQDPVVVLLGTYPKEMNMSVHTKILPQVFIATLS